MFSELSKIVLFAVACCGFRILIIVAFLVSSLFTMNSYYFLELNACSLLMASAAGARKNCGKNEKRYVESRMLLVHDSSDRRYNGADRRLWIPYFFQPLIKTKL